MGKPGKKAGKGMLPPTNVNRGTNREKTHLRDNRTIKRLKMYNSKIVRNEKGEIVKGSVLGAADRVETTMARIAPDRRWFGNTRTIGQQALQKFRTEMGERYRDPYSVVIKQKKLPLSLLEEPTEKNRVQQQMQFSNTFGERATRKRVKMGASVGSFDDLMTRAADSKTAFSATRAESLDDGTSTRKVQRRRPVSDIVDADATVSPFESGGIDPSAMQGGGANTNGDDDDDFDYGNRGGKNDKSNRSLFKKGQSNRIWNELYKVIDSADIICYVVDARDPMGTRSSFIEDYLRREKKHKHFVLILNKCDLIPLWATARWLQILSKDFPTIAFHASVDHPFGKGNLISILRQFSRLHNVTQRGRQKAPVSVGVIGYPNVGKSSVINTLRRKSVCKTAPIPGETKVWQYVALTRSIFLIDCPGIVYDREGNNDVNAVLKGVVRVERLGAADKSDVVQAVLSMVKRKDIEATYNVTQWHDAPTFLDELARARGKLLPGGVPDCDIVARTVLYDWQRGKIPWFVAPPFDSERAQAGATAAPDAKLLENIEKLNSLNVEGDTIHHGAGEGDSGEEGADDEADLGEIDADADEFGTRVAGKRRGRGGGDDDDGGQEQQGTTGSKAKANVRAPKNTANVNALGKAGFSTVVTASAAVEAAEKKKKRAEARQAARSGIQTAAPGASGAAAPAASSASESNQALWNAFVAASN